MTKHKSARNRRNESSSGSEYEVGYRKPPAEHRFRAGQSGNRKGRPRGRKNFGQLFKTILLGKVNITERSGRVRSMSRAEAMLQNVMAKALSGEPKQVQLVLDLMERFDVKVVEEPTVKSIVIRYVKPKTPPEYKDIVDESKRASALEEARRQRQRARTPQIGDASERTIPPRVIRNFPLVGRQRRRR